MNPRQPDNGNDEEILELRYFDLVMKNVGSPQNALANKMDQSTVYLFDFQ